MSKLFLFSAPYDFLGDLQAAFADALPPGFAAPSFHEVWDRDDLPDAPDLTAWICNPGQRFVIDGPVLDRYPNLEILITASTGKNHIDVAACEDRGIPVLGLLDERPTLSTIRASVEFTFLMILMALRRPEKGMAEVSAGRWRHNEEMLRGRELFGRRVGIIGLGRIGGHVAEWSEAFGASVIYSDPYVDDPRFRRATLEQTFDEADVLCVCCVLTPETTELVTYDLLSRMPQDAVFVNTSRGETVNHDDLVRFSNDRPDVTLALDVLPGEVTDTHMDSPLIDLHNQGRAIITPHIAGATFDSQRKAALAAKRLLARFYGMPDD